MRSYNPPGGMTNPFRRSVTPATLVLMVVNVITFFVSATPSGAALFHWLGFRSADWTSRPWTLVTWTLVTRTDPFFLVVLLAFVWMFCSSIERSWGTRIYVPFFLVTSAIMALCMWFGSLILRQDAALFGLLFLHGPSAVAWSYINRHETVSIWGVIPAPAVWIAVFSCVVVWYFGGASVSPILGLFPVLGCITGYGYAKHGRYMYRGYAKKTSPLERFRKDQPGLRLIDLENDRRPGSPSIDLNPLRWYGRWKTRRVVEKLLRRSSDTDPRDM